MSATQLKLDLGNVETGSRYKIIERPDGFRVEGRKRVPVDIEWYPTFLAIKGSDKQRSRWNPDGIKRFGFYEYYRFSKHIAERLMSAWEPPERVGQDYEPRWLRPWAVTQTAKAIGGRVYVQWKRLLAKVDPSVLAVHRAVFAAAMRCCSLAMDEELYRHKYIVSDITSYRAAAIAAANAARLSTEREKALVRSSPKAQQILKLLAELEGEAESCSLLLKGSLEINQDALPKTDPLTAMQNWRGLFSYNGKPYRSLNRTLMNLPGGVPEGFVCELNDIQLTRPYVERLELLALLISHSVRAERVTWLDDLLTMRRIDGPNLHIFTNARTPQIKEALSRIAEHTQNELNPRRCRDVKFTIDFLGDFPERHTGNIVGLADKAIIWHRVRREHEIAEQVEALGADTETIKPPIPLPRQEGVTFLNTVEAVCREGLEMEHCVASYAKSAVSGQCYLFHIEHNGDRATAEVDVRGHVSQIHGPRNKRNGAARWGQRVLKQWGRQFPKDVPRPISNLPVHNDEF